MAKRDNTRQGNQFPREIFPKAIQKLVSELERTNQFPVDYSCGAILSSISTAIGNTIRIRVKNGFIQPALLNMALVGPPGVNKSAPINFFLHPLYLEDDKINKKYLEDKKKYNQAKAIAAEKGDKCKASEPIRTQTIVNDTTLEGIIAIHATTPKGICIHADELLGWINTFGRYHKGAEEQTYLTLYNGGPIKITRRNADLDVSLPYTCVNVIGSIQPDVLPQLLNRDKISNGFVDRILFVYPDNPRIVRWTEDEADPQIISVWDTIISKLIHCNITWDQGPSYVVFTKEAQKALCNWQNKIADKDDDAEPYIKGIHAKLETYVIRFCLILHVLDCICNNINPLSDIMPVTVKKSISLFCYFDSNALLARAVSEIKGSTWEQFYADLPEKFQTKVAMNLAKKYGISGRSAYRFLAKDLFFDNEIKNSYTKKFSIIKNK